MGKVQHIMKSRKEYVCGKCRRKIPVGSEYYKGQVMYMPAIIRCTGCGLKWYEVTTSDYIRDVGAIKEDWQESFTVQDGVWEEISANLEEILDGCNERLENMPEQLQEADVGQMLQERIDGLETAMDELSNCSMEEFLTDALGELTEEQQEILAQEGDISDPESWYLEFWQKGSELAQAWQETAEEAIINAIDLILEDIPCE